VVLDDYPLTLEKRRIEEQEGKMKMAIRKSLLINHHFYFLTLLSLTYLACLRSQAQSLPKEEGDYLLLVFSPIYSKFFGSKYKHSMKGFFTFYLFFLVWVIVIMRIVLWELQ
jgi:hypothetical protein